jgi:hypothetical protein
MSFLGAVGYVLIEELGEVQAAFPDCLIPENLLLVGWGMVGELVE